MIRRREREMKRTAARKEEKKTLPIIQAIDVNHYLCQGDPINN